MFGDASPTRASERSLISTRPIRALAAPFIDTQLAIATNWAAAVFLAAAHQIGPTDDRISGSHSTVGMTQIVQFDQETPGFVPACSSGPVRNRSILTAGQAFGLNVTEGEDARNVRRILSG